MIFQEMSNNPPRIVPLDGRPPLPARIRQWPGDGRGRWEGGTSRSLDRQAAAEAAGGSK